VLTGAIILATHGKKRGSQIAVLENIRQVSEEKTAKINMKNGRMSQELGVLGVLGVLRVSAELIGWSWELWSIRTGRHPDPIVALAQFASQEFSVLSRVVVYKNVDIFSEEFTLRRASLMTGENACPA